MEGQNPLASSIKHRRQAAGGLFASRRIHRHLWGHVTNTTAVPEPWSITERWGMLDGQFQLKGLTRSANNGMIPATALERDLTIVM